MYWPPPLPPVVREGPRLVIPAGDDAGATDPATMGTPPLLILRASFMSCCEEDCDETAAEEEEEGETAVLRDTGDIIDDDTGVEEEVDDGVLCESAVADDDDDVDVDNDDCGILPLEVLSEDNIIPEGVNPCDGPCGSAECIDDSVLIPLPLVGILDDDDVNALL